MTDTIDDNASRDRYCDDRTPRDRRNQRRYTVLLAAWAVVYLVSTYLIATERVVSGPLGWVVAGLSSVFAVFAVLAYWRYLREADELARAIELQALAIAVCSGFIVWPALDLAGELGVPTQALPDPIVLVMIGSYAVGTILGRRRYG